MVVKKYKRGLKIHVGDILVAFYSRERFKVTNVVSHSGNDGQLTAKKEDTKIYFEFQIAKEESKKRIDLPSWTILCPHE